MDGLEAFDLEGERVEVLESFVDYLAVRTDCLVADLALEDVLHNIPERRLLEGVLDSIEEEVEELLGVLLDGDIDWLSIHVLPGETELIRIVILPFGQLKVSEH